MDISDLLLTGQIPPGSPAVIVNIEGGGTMFGGVVVRFPSEVPILVSFAGAGGAIFTNEITVEGDTGSVDHVQTLELHKSTNPITGFNVIPSGPTTAIANFSSSFLQLVDTPNTYAGQTLKLVRVKSDETELEFADPSGIFPDVDTFLGLTDAPHSYSGQASKVVTVNGGETALVFTSGIQRAGTLVQVTGSNFTTTSNALVDITGLTYAALANSVYEFDIVLSCSSSTNGGIAIGVNYSAAGASVAWSGTVTANDSNPGTIGTAKFNVHGGSFASTAGAVASTNVRGILTTGANAGNFTVQILKQISGTATVFIKSRMIVYPL